MATFTDQGFWLVNISDGTKKAQFDCSAISTATRRLFGLPDADTIIAGLSIQQTFTKPQTIDDNSGATDRVVQSVIPWFDASGTSVANVAEWRDRGINDGATNFLGTWVDYAGGINSLNFTLWPAGASGNPGIFKAAATLTAARQWEFNNVSMRFAGSASGGNLATGRVVLSSGSGNNLLTTSASLLFSGTTLTIDNLTFNDAHDIAAGTTTGTKIGTVGGASGQKFGFFGATPVVQPLLATGAGKTVDDVITALQTLGLVRQT